MGNQPSLELEGLQVLIDRVLYHYEPKNLPEGKPHVFIYFITINNMSDRKLTLLARKWIIESDDQDVDVIEGDKLIFIVDEGQMAKAIGKHGANVKRLSNMLKRDLKIVEFNPTQLHRSPSRTSIRNLARAICL